MVKNRPLTIKERKYCQARAKGLGYEASYREAGYSMNCKRKTREINAFNMEHYDARAPLIRAKIEELQKRADEKAILGRQERQALLTEIALDEEKDTPDRLRAVDQLNRMGGDYTDTIRSEVTGKVSMTFDERIAAIQAALEG